MNRLTTIRLPPEIRGKLVALARAKGRSKSDITKEALDMHFRREEECMGSLGIGEGDCAASHKVRHKEKLARRLSG